MCFRRRDMGDRDRPALLEPMEPGPKRSELWRQAEDDGGRQFFLHDPLLWHPCLICSPGPGGCTG